MEGVCVIWRSKYVTEDHGGGVSRSAASARVTRASAAAASTLFLEECMWEDRLPRVHVWRSACGSASGGREQEMFGEAVVAFP